LLLRQQQLMCNMLVGCLYYCPNAHCSACGCCHTTCRHACPATQPQPAVCIKAVWMLKWCRKTSVSQQSNCTRVQLQDARVSSSHTSTASPTSSRHAHGEVMGTAGGDSCPPHSSSAVTGNPPLADHMLCHQSITAPHALNQPAPAGRQCLVW
jgi:hypothetical protein